MKLPCKSHAPHKPKTFEGGHKQRPSLPLPGENAPFYPKVKNKKKKRKKKNYIPFTTKVGVWGWRDKVAPRPSLFFFVFFFSWAVVPLEEKKKKKKRLRRFPSRVVAILYPWGLFGSLFGFLMKKGCLAQAHFFAKRLAAYQNARPIAQESENTKVNIRQRDRGSEIKEGRGTLWPSMFFGNFFIFCRPIMEKWNGAAGTEHGPPFEDGFFALCFVFFFFLLFSALGRLR